MPLTETERLELLDEAAVRLCRGYSDVGLISYIIHMLEDGSIRIIGPSMPADVVADMFGKAIDGYAKSEGTEVRGELN
jgi:hypothetical protein